MRIQPKACDRQEVTRVPQQRCQRVYLASLSTRFSGQRYVIGGMLGVCAGGQIGSSRRLAVARMGQRGVNTLTSNRGRAARSDPVARCPEMKCSRFAGGKSAVTRPRSDDIIMFGSGSASRSKQALD